MKSPLLLFATIVFSAALLTSCDEPGEGQKAEIGKTLGVQLAAALEQFKAQHGQYPRKLMELSPDYAEILDGPVRKKADQHGVTFGYGLKMDGAYELTFSYSGPGKNHCLYKRGGHPPLWECWGYY